MSKLAITVFSIIFLSYPVSCLSDMLDFFDELAERKNAYVNWVVDNSKLSFSDAISLVDVVLDISEKVNVDEKIILSIIKVESTFKKSAVSPVGAKGYMQVMEKFHKDKLIKAKAEGFNKNLFNIKTNVYIGSRIYKDCEDRFVTTRKALLCYNGSLGTKSNYAKKVLKAHAELMEI